MRTFHDPQVGALAELAAALDATMSLGPQTGVVAGQRNTFPTWAQWSPMGYGPQTTGVPLVSPTIPPFVGAANASGFSGAGVAEQVGGYGTAANNGLVTQIANANPWNMRVSPVLWAIGLLLLGLVMLRGIHWRETTLEGFEEHGHVGPASERAEEAA